MVVHAVRLDDDADFAFSGGRGEVEGVFEVAHVIDADAAGFHAWADDADPAAFEVGEGWGFDGDGFAEEVEAAGVWVRVDELDDASGEVFLAAAGCAADEESVGEPVALVCGGEEVVGFVSGERHAATSCPAGLGAQPEMMVESGRVFSSCQRVGRGQESGRAAIFGGAFFSRPR